ncbi:MAG: phosphoribosylamine--glycine ligase [Pseudomonadota bacterium]
MRVLIIGNGGREHALCWKLSQSPLVRKIINAPGNAGTAKMPKSENVLLPPEDLHALVAFASTEGVDLTIVGPERPLTLGIVDRFQERGLKILGPTQSAARLESSKIFGKEIMKAARVATADSGVFDNLERAERYLQGCPYPVVLKADAPAIGKKVCVARLISEAVETARAIMSTPTWGGQTPRLLVEEYLKGEEVSFLLITDGNDVLPLATARHYRRLLDGNRGADTPGMGACSPSSSCTPQIQAEVERQIVRPVVQVLRERKLLYSGILSIKLMLTAQDPKVLGFNVSFGDPETQAILPRLDSDLAELLARASRGRLRGAEIRWKAETAVTVVLVSEGYPAKVKSGQRIYGTERASDQAIVFHAGTDTDAEHLIVRGGRVLSVSALGQSLQEARDRAYRVAERIEFEGKVFRPDIGLAAPDPHPSV